MHTAVGKSASGVRRDKAALSSGCKSHPANAPAGSSRSSYGGDEILKPLECVSRIGDSASVQAVTRVNAGMPCECNQTDGLEEPDTSEVIDDTGVKQSADVARGQHGAF
jgi:hypothetical protein